MAEQFDLDEAAKPVYKINLIGGSHEADSVFNREGFVGGVRSLLVNVLRWYIVKWFFMMLFLGIALGFGLKNLDDKAIDDISSHLASDGWFKAFDIFASKAMLKSEVTNKHPLYASDEIKELSVDLGFQFKKVFWYVTYQGNDIFIMRKLAVNHKGEDIKLELSSLMGMDATEYCENFGGYVADKGLVAHAATKINLIHSAKGEAFYDGTWDGKQKFRCYVMAKDFRGAE